MLRIRTLCLLTTLLSGQTAIHAELQLPAMFTDSMVLQRNQPVKVWGWATAGSEISVSIGDQKSSAMAEDSGLWSLTRDSLSAGGPHTLSVIGDGGTVTLKDVLVGEVWLCSGQSNMAMTVSRSKNADQETASANHPQIRMFKVGSGHSLEPKETCTGS